jgi:expansin (peptidoglycan-binding protein)
MSRKIALVAKTLVLFFLLLMIILPSSFTVDWPVFDSRLTTHGKVDWTPSITSTTDGEIWVVWRSDRTGNDELFYKVFNGSSWTEDIQLTNDTYCDDYPSITQTSDGKIWVVWTSNRVNLQGDLFYKVFNGSSWTEDIQLTNNTYTDADPSITQISDDKIWVVWTSNRVDLQWDLFYRVFNGSSWSSDARITNDTDSDDWYPSVMQSTGGLIWIAFSKFSSTHTFEDIYYKQYNGTTWGPDVRFTFNDEAYDRHPSIMQAKNGPIWVVWDSFRNDHDDDIYYKVFNGQTWSPETRLTAHLSDDLWPSITQAADNTIWVAWGSIRLNNFDIYYTIGEVHDVAITEVTTSTTIAVRGENVSIEVTAQNQGSTTENFEVQCYVNSTLVGSKTISVSAGQTLTLSPFHWNTSGAPRGTYIISATVAAVLGEIYLIDNSKSAEIPVEVRIKGDVCGMYNGVVKPIPNGVVDLDDLMTVAMPGHIWTEYPTWDPVWGPACDVNKDGRVGMDDVMEVGLHLADT